MQAALDEDVATALISQFGMKQEGLFSDSRSASVVAGERPPEKVDRPAVPSTALESLLQKGASEWCFDSFELDRLSEGRPLSTLGFFLLARSGVLTALRVDQPKLVDFLLKVDWGPV